MKPINCAVLIAFLLIKFKHPNVSHSHKIVYSNSEKMDRWLKKTAVVTGASSGIGAAIAIALAKENMTVIALGRRIERLEQLKVKVPIGSKGAIHARQCDVTKEDEVKATFDWVNDTFGGTDVLVNNAGIAKVTNLVDANNTAPIREVVETNILAVVYCTREAFQSMKSRNVNGHVIIINSIVGHTVPMFVGKMSSLNIYPGTKHAVTAMTEVFRQEFQELGTQTKITVSRVELIGFSGMYK